jgi:xanthine dehydrogenase YagS FAD-binding subunit
VLPRFAYVRPTTLREAVRHLAGPDARAHAGGTDLLGSLRDGVVRAQTLVSLSGVRELRGITDRDDGGLRIGALATLSELAVHPRVLAGYAALAQGALSAATPQIRNQGTLGGNLCQRPRCWYFRGGFDCPRNGGTGCYAVGGENRYHALFGGSACVMVHPSDTAAPLVALDAHARLVGPAGERIVPMEAFFILPDEDVTRENVLQRGEFLAEVRLPRPPGELRSAYRKVKARGSWDFALAGAAVAARISGGRIAGARVVLSGVAPVPWRSKAAEEALDGVRPGYGAATRAAAAAMGGAHVLDGNAYKVGLIRAVVHDAVMALV